MKHVNLLQSWYRTQTAQFRCWATFLALLIPFFVLERLLHERAMWLAQAILLVGGWCTWTFIEYLLHRFYLHEGKKGGTRLSRDHHYHHTHPAEIHISGKQRVVLLLLLLVLLLLAVWFRNYFTLVAGFGAGIFSYFVMHWVLHQPWTAKLFRKLFRYHLYHHCKYPDTCYGVCVPWWDDIFETVPPRETKISPRVLDFYLNNQHHQHTH